MILFFTRLTAASAILFFGMVAIDLLNIYPFGYPVQQGKYYRITWEDSWAEVKIDSISGGRLVRCRTRWDDKFMNGVTLRQFVAAGVVKEISKEDFEN